MKFKIIFLILVLFLSGNIIAQEKDEYGNYNLKTLSEEDAMRIFGENYAPKIFKTNGDPRLIKESIINGNAITTILFNYGSICAPNRLGNIADLVWNGLGYGFEFGPLAAAEVIDDSGKVQHIVDDSFIRTFQGDYSPDGTLKWGWLPKDGYVDPDQNEIARLSIGDSDGDGKPDSWPDRWYSPGAGKYLWPAFLGDQATAPDEEVFYVVDDYTNAEFPYTPFPSDTSKKGLGLDMEVRIIQFNNPLAEDIMFLVYQITNASEKRIEKSYFGMHGDPHVGGPADYGDDLAGFIDPFGNSLQGTNFPQRSRNMVYSWDGDGRGMGGRTTGYFGWKFLESPSNATDAFDNDDDGITDETPENSAGNFIDGVSIPLTQGISDVAKYTAVFGAPKPRFEGDEDGDWNPDKDDVGIDGIGPDSPNYPGPDFGEGDGVPSQAWYLDTDGNGDYDEGEPLSEVRLTGYKWAGSEPNFGLRDISESDQIGLSSFHAAVYTNSDPNVPRNDPLMWEWLSADTIDASQELLSSPGDNVFNFGTGPLSLDIGETQRFSMCILFGTDLNDLVLNAETSTRILEADYRFAQPPAKPIVRAVPGDGRVTLYWDTRAEESVDPLSGKKDFQGYKIYRSRDYTFSDVFTITDGRGNPFLGKPLAQFDLIDSLKGYHPVEYAGRAVKYYVGDNTGLVHKYVDSTVTNGINYYYAVVAYDGGTDEIPPSENKAVILRDPITGELTFDPNTVQVTPGPLGAGVEKAEAGVNGQPIPAEWVNSTGEINIEVLEDLEVKEKLYSIDFLEPELYNVLDSTGVTDEITSKDTVFVDLSKKNIQLESVQVFDAGNNLVDPSKYFVNPGFGKIRGTSSGSFPAGEKFTVKYRYYPVYQSTLVNSEDGNPAFDGLKVYVQKDELALDVENSGWAPTADVNVRDSLQYDPNGNYPGSPKTLYRADWEVRWNDLDTLADGSWANVGSRAWAPLTGLSDTVDCPFVIWNITEDVPANFFVVEQKDTKGNGRWDWGDGIILRATNAGPTESSYYLEFSLPSDSNVTPKLPKAGDVYTVRTRKPFLKGDKYTFETKPVKFSGAKAKPQLENVYVVPNPYVAYSIAEEPGRSADKRGDKVIQFRNLPPTCTIRIYTITGELVQTIEKDDMSNMATWDLLSFEGQRVAYGVYIYHVDAPGVGEKIGRFALIK